MLLGHTTFSEQAFQDARLDAVHNIEFAETGFGMTFTLGTEVATGGANVSPEGSSFTMGLGDETAFGEAFQRRHPVDGIHRRYHAVEGIMVHNHILTS